MPLIILEGVDRTGKSTVAEYYKTQGYEVVHQSAPPKGQTADNYLEEQMRLVSSAASKNIVLDRSYYGEIGVWPKIYGRDSLLTEDGLEVLRELEESVGTTRILMHDPLAEAHWQRCVENKEPLTKAQFVYARNLFRDMVDKYGFTLKTLKDYTVLSENKHDDASAVRDIELSSRESTQHSARSVSSLTPEQQKLETANAINDVLSKRILKQKGPIYDQLENSLRAYLNTELGKIFGTNPPGEFSEQEVEILKFFAKKLMKEVK